MRAPCRRRSCRLCQRTSPRSDTCAIRSKLLVQSCGACQKFLHHWEGLPSATLFVQWHELAAGHSSAKRWSCSDCCCTDWKRSCWHRWVVWGPRDSVQVQPHLQSSATTVKIFLTVLQMLQCNGLPLLCQKTLRCCPLLLVSHTRSWSRVHGTVSHCGYWGSMLQSLFSPVTTVGRRGRWPRSCSLLRCYMSAASPCCSRLRPIFATAWAHMHPET
mmetsp:Transcript_109717/g.321154  ORF Transcript_109717/g.321154 Transcript_109717/m.321154 type:complete len:216 (+) Transcript_109717:591-1238(+)